MLEFFRQHVGGLLGVIVIGTISVAFALSFGSQSAGWGKGQVMHVKATVDGEDIPETTLRYAMNLMGGRGAGDESQRFALQKVALDGLVERQLLVSLAEDMGISANMDEALDNIAEDKVYLTRPVEELHDRLSRNFFMSTDTLTAALVEDGHRVGQSFKDAKGAFNLDGYKKFVRNYLQVTEETFEEQQRLELVARRVRQIMVSGVRVAPDEVREQYNRENDNVVLEYVRFSPTLMGEKLAATPEEIAAWAALHQDEVKQYYETNKFRYTGLEKQVRARHVLLKVEEGADAATKQGVRDRIDGLLARAKAGEDFAELAKANSEDEGSAKNGGDLGFNPKGKMVAAFDDVMFSTPPGAISEVVETQYGFHIIKVDEVREGDIPMDKATIEIAEKLMREARGKEKAKAVADAVSPRLNAGETFEAILASLTAEDPTLAELKPIATRPVSRADKTISGGIGASPEIAQAAFASATDPTALHKVFEVASDYYVVRVKERKNPTDEDFTKQRDELTRSLLSLKQAAFLRGRLAELLEQAKKDGRIKYYGQADAMPVEAANAAPKSAPKAEGAAAPVAPQELPKEEPSPEANPKAGSGEQAEE